MSRASLFGATAAAMIAFAANSLLCRVALRQMQIDPATFTAIRIVSGGVALWLVLQARPRKGGGDWMSACALFAYAAAFSLAYLSLPAGTGALLLFAAVQGTMIVAGVRNGERLRVWQWSGVAIAFGGVVLLLLPGIAAPSVRGSLLMLSAGVAWGIYSLRGKRATDPIAATAGNFIRAMPLAFLLAAAFIPWARLTFAGITYAVISGAITSGLGYVIWYSVLPSLKATSAATVQLSAPVIAALGGILLLGESMTLHLIVASAVVLVGIALALIRTPPRARDR